MAENLGGIYRQGNLKVLDELIAPNFVRHDPVNPGKGPQAERDAVTKYRSAFPDCRIDLEEVLALGDRVITRFRWSGTHRNTLDGIAPTGRTVSGTGMSITRFSGNRIAEAHIQWDALGLLQQLGVVTLPGMTITAGR
jgi:predicted ester cyclase